MTATSDLLSPLLEETGGGAFWLGREDKDATALPRLAMLRSGSRPSSFHSRTALISRIAGSPRFTIGSHLNPWRSSDAVPPIPYAYGLN